MRVEPSSPACSGSAASRIGTAPLSPPAVAKSASACVRRNAAQHRIDDDGADHDHEREREQRGVDELAPRSGTLGERDAEQHEHRDLGQRGELLAERAHRLGLREVGASPSTRPKR